MIRLRNLCSIFRFCKFIGLEFLHGLVGLVVVERNSRVPQAIKPGVFTHWRIGRMRLTLHLQLRRHSQQAGEPHDAEHHDADSARPADDGERADHVPRQDHGRAAEHDAVVLEQRHGHQPPQAAAHVHGHGVQRVVHCSRKYKKYSRFLFRLLEIL